MPPPSSPTSSNLPGRIAPEDFAFRGGLLLATILFLAESLGSPLTRNVVGLGALLASALAVSTMAVSWRTLGDWRQGYQATLLLGLIIALAFPIAAVLSPDLSRAPIPASIRAPMEDIARGASYVPTLELMIKFITALVSFFLLLVFLIILILGTGTRSKIGLVFLATIVGFFCLLIYPAIETGVGLLFLGVFLYHQWEKPLLLSEHIAERLTPDQRDLLLSLIDGDPISVGETRLLLNNDPAQFMELSELELVTVDPINKSIVGGEKLLHDKTVSAYEQYLELCRSAIWIALGVIYILLPDVIPGPIDEIIVLLLTMGAGGRILMILLTARKEKI